MRHSDLIIFYSLLFLKNRNRIITTILKIFFLILSVLLTFPACTNLPHSVLWMDTIALSRWSTIYSIYLLLMNLGQSTVWAIANNDVWKGPQACVLKKMLTRFCLSQVEWVWAFFFLSFSFIIYKMNINDNSTLILWLWELNDGREPSTEPGLTFTIMLLWILSLGLCP